MEIIQWHNFDFDLHGEHLKPYKKIIGKIYDAAHGPKEATEE
jgi:hypothetical protein